MFSKVHALNSAASDNSSIYVGLCGAWISSKHPRNAKYFTEFLCKVTCKHCKRILDDRKPSKNRQTALNTQKGGNFIGMRKYLRSLRQSRIWSIYFVIQCPYCKHVTKQTTVVGALCRGVTCPKCGKDYRLSNPEDKDREKSKDLPL